MALTDNITAWYRGFDNTDATGSYDLILQNDASTDNAGDNKCGSYFTFPKEGPGGGSYLDVSSAGAIDINSDQGLTFSTWVYNITTSSDIGWLLRCNGFHVPFYILSSGNIAFIQNCFGASTYDSGYDLRSNITPNTWHHLTMVISGRSWGPPVTPTAKYYLDGTLVATITLHAGCNPFSATGGPAGIGEINNESTGGGYLKAFERLTDIIFWNRALDIVEIQEISQKCLYDILNPPGPGPIINSDPWASDPLVASDRVFQNITKASGQRSRRVGQIPLTLSTKTNIARRRGSDSDFE